MMMTRESVEMLANEFQSSRTIFNDSTTILLYVDLYMIEKYVIP